MRTSAKKIRLYRFNGGTHYNGGLFPEYPNNTGGWCKTIEEARKPYLECSIKNFDADKLTDMNLGNSISDGMGFLFIWLILETCEVSLKAWQNDQNHTGQYAEDYIGNDCDWGFETIEERGMYLNGRPMSKKVFDKIIYAGKKQNYFKIKK